MKNENTKKTWLDIVLDILWPVNSDEVKKFLPMSLMLMLIIFIYSMLRATKDAALIPILGAEMISTVKLWGVMPFAIIFMLVYTKLSSILANERIFYLMITFFLGFFAAYAFIFYPNQDSFHFDFSILKTSLPTFLRLPVVMFENWTISMFYIMSELWGSVMLSLLFWQFANQITPVPQAKRFYSLFGLLGQIGMVASSEIAQYIAKINKVEVIGVDVWGETLRWLIMTVLVAGALIAFIYWWMNRYVLTDIRHYNPELISSAKTGKKKLKLSMSESFKLIFTSKYLGMIAALVLCYGVSIILIEAVWKAQVGIQFPQRVDYLAFMGRFQGWTAYMTMLAMVVGGNLIRRVSWFAGAIITPLMVIVTGILFFVFIIMRTELEPTLAAIGTTALMMAVVVGAVQNILSKSIKYSAFDATKEMAYIPLSDDLKAKGKAAVDVVGARLGKSGGSLIQQVLFAVTGLQLVGLTYEIFAIFLVVMLVWLYSVSNLSKAFEKQAK
jgi:ATP:ADP antiporter, AAA family